MRINRLLVAVTAVTLVLSGCKKDVDPKPDAPTGTLTADAGANQTTKVGTAITLDGSASKDSENKSFTYQWAITQKPTSSTATLSNATTAKPSFTPDQAGDYEVELTIANRTKSSKDKVTVTATPAVVPATLLAEVISAGTVLEDRVADPNLPDYVVDKRLVVNAELTIKPGVVIAFARDAQFNVTASGGILIAKGEADKKIRFIGKEATKGFWQGLYITSESSGNVLDQVEILHGGGREVYSSSKAGLTLSGKAQLVLKNSLISLSDGYGLHAADGTALREFALNKFCNNTESGASVSADNVKMLDSLSVFTSNNGRDLVEILKSNLSERTTETVWRAFKDKTPYRLLSNLGVQTGLRFNPGVVLQTNRDVIIIVDSKGYLTAVGTPTSRIRISGKDEGTGIWRGIHYSYSASSLNKLEYVDISGGGSSQSLSGQQSNIAISGSTTVISIKNCTISKSAGYGIYVTYDARNRLNEDAATANKFESNTKGPILIDK